MTRVYMLHFTRHYKDNIQGRLKSFVPNLLEYMCASNYFNMKRFDKVIAKVKRCSFLTRSVCLLYKKCDAC